MASTSRLRPIAVSGERRVQPELGQIADQKARSRAAGSGDDGVLFSAPEGGSGLGLGLVAGRPLADSTAEEQHP